MILKDERKVNYHADPQDDLKFVIENYTMAKPFSSFFPGVAGLMGIPLWCFYVNRGQAVCSFGVQNKDSAIMEFQPANKAYRQTSMQGFRTFLKFSRNGQEYFYEPFQENQANAGFILQNTMTISPYDLCIEERNETLGIIVNVTYFTIPGEPVAALARIVKFTNLTDTEIQLELLDGMPVMIPYGTGDGVLKNISRTAEAWAYVENLENRIPYYRVKIGLEDSTDVVHVEGGNFYFGFHKERDGIKLLKPIIDPGLIFGHVNDLSYPFEFCKCGFNTDAQQYYTNRTGCALGHTLLKIEGNGDESIYSLVGHAENLDTLKKLSDAYLKEEFFIDKAKQNREIIRELMDRAFVNSSSREFNSYCRQSFLDNLIRGGFPLSVQSGNKRDVMYVYSRKHGDLERDYNDFQLMPTFFSQGNGAYRDINQNRRNDIWFSPDVGYSNIVYFVDLIRLDGFNPLAVKGVSYIFENSRENGFLKTLVEESAVERLAAFIGKPFIPHGLLEFVKHKDIVLKVTPLKFISKIIPYCRKLEEAAHGAGYWTDHWHYNIDLLESFDALFPDVMQMLLTGKRLFSFYDDEYHVLPRNERYVLCNGRPRQTHSLIMDKEKRNLVLSRNTEPNKVRTKNGKGDICHTSLLTKLICIAVNKIASLDSNGVGIEMEAGKPNWNDSINGLPGLFGSSISETFELKRLILQMQEWIVRFGLKGKKVKIPLEIAEFMESIFEALKSNMTDDRPESDFNYWDLSNDIKEAFRESIRFGVDGREADVGMEELGEFLCLALSKIEKAIGKGYDPETHIYNTYYMNEPLEFEVTDTKGKYVNAGKFRQIPLAPFLEGQVHALRVERDMGRARELYQAVQETELYDEDLGMYKTNGSLKEFPMELGRIRAFSPGWLENESVFMHMEYKYLLELIRSGLADEFYKAAKTAFVPFLKPEVYGRSIFENSTFIASSVNPDNNMRGNGFVARLSGTTAEFYHMLLVMALGSKPFSLNAGGEPEMTLNPSLPGWLFTEAPTKTALFIEGMEIEVALDANTYCFRFLGDVLLVYHNPKRLDTYGSGAAKVSSVSISKAGGGSREFAGAKIPAPYAADIRKGVYRRIDAVLD